MHRGWMDKRIFEREPFDRRSAWSWLIENAMFADSSGLARGQIRASLRFLAKAWGWQEPKVRRYLSAAQNAEMIVCVADAGRTLITICNYDKYQCQHSVADARPDAKSTQYRRIADANYKEGKKEEGILDSPNGESYRNAFDRWWEGYPEKVGKGAAKKSFTKALTKTSLDQLMVGLDRYKATKPVDRPWCNPATWLNQERWLDVPGSNVSASNVVSFGGPPTGPPPIPEGGFFPVDGLDPE